MQTDKARILIVAFSDLGRDPRVYRQIQFLKEEYAVTAAGLGDPQIPGVRYIQIPGGRNPFWKRNWDRCLLKAGRFERVYWSSQMVRAAEEVLGKEEFDLILCNDLETLPLAVRLAKKRHVKLFLDAHEYKPRHFDDDWFFQFFYGTYWDTLCRRYLPEADAMTTVCPGIAEEYEKNYSVRCEVITSAPFYEELAPSPTEADRIRMIHHGGLHRSRRIENMIRLMDMLEDRFTLDLILINSNPRYYKELNHLARRHERIRWRDPVSMPEIARKIHEYDIGLFLLWPGAYNYRMALPNKFFEFIQARLAIAIWPSPEMARVVREYDCGVVADDFTVEAMAVKLNSLGPEDITRYKQNAHQAATGCCAEANRDILLKIVRRLLD